MRGVAKCDVSACRGNAVMGAGMLSSSIFVAGARACSSSPPYLNTDCPQSAVGADGGRMGRIVCGQRNIKRKNKFKSKGERYGRRRWRRQAHRAYRA